MQGAFAVLRGARIASDFTKLKELYEKRAGKAREDLLDTKRRMIATLPPKAAVGFSQKGACHLGDFRPWHMNRQHLIECLEMVKALRLDYFLWQWLLFLPFFLIEDSDGSVLAFLLYNPIQGQQWNEVVCIVSKNGLEGYGAALMYELKKLRLGIIAKVDHPRTIS